MIVGNRTLAIGVACAVAGIVFRAWRKRPGDVTEGRARAVRVVTLQCDAEAAYDAWMDPVRRATFLPRTFEIEVVDARRPLRIEWRAMKRRPMDAGGAITFAPAPEGRGTEARFSMHVSGRGAQAAAVFARLFGAAPAQIAAESLRSFKALMEAGEVPIAVRA